MHILQLHQRPELIDESVLLVISCKAVSVVQTDRDSKHPPPALRARVAATSSVHKLFDAINAAASFTVPRCIHQTSFTP